MKSVFIKMILGGFIFTLSIILNAAAQATDDSTLGERALTTAKKLEQLALVDNTKRDMSPLEQHQHSRLDIWNGFDSSSDVGFLDTISDYHRYAISSGQQTDIELAQLFVDLSKIYNPYFSDSASDVKKALDFLDPYLTNDNWLVQHSATIISSVIYSYERDIPLALELAGNSFTTIPNDETFDAKLARLYSYSLTTYLHGLLKNPEMYISSVEGLIDSSEKIGYPIESVNYLNNLIYAMRGTEDSDVMRQLVDSLLRVGEAQPSDTLGLVEMRASNALVRIGDFERALVISQRGLKLTDNERISGVLKIAEIQSLAATGNIQTAEAKLLAFEHAIRGSGLPENMLDNEISKAKALIAMAKGDAKATFKFMDRHAELSIQRLLRSNNSDTSNLLANLENDKARQAEREAAREEMFRLEQQALEQRIAASQRGMLIVLLLAGAAILLAVFMTYRSRVSKQLAIAAEAALAGEKAKTQFLAVISHELRTPLNGIIGIADLLSHTAPTSDLREKIGIINNSGQDLLKLVEQILDMSRIDANELEVFPENADVREVISGIDMLWRPTIENKGVIFTSHVDASVPEYLTLDPMRLRQCVNNLVSNAAKFTKEGRVHLHVFATAQPNSNSALMQIIVADTGLGIRQDVQDNLFRPFIQADSSITRQYGGSGLGLAITRSLARMMGGDLNVKSRHGAGSEFTLTLMAQYCEDAELLDAMDDMFGELAEARPRSTDDVSEQLAETENAITIVDPHLAENITAREPVDISARIDSQLIDIEIDTPAPVTPIAPLPASKDIDDLRGVRVLVVEDVQSNQDVMKIFLEPEGCEIMCADNGHQALSALKSQDFDVILMDIRMPEMDGIEATRLIRGDTARNSHVPIIALTADATAETNAQCMAAGANIFLTKPIIATELYDSIRFVRRQALHRAETQRAEEEVAKTVKRLSL